MPIFATTSRVDMARRLALYWGVTPVCTDIGEDVDSAGALVAERLLAGGQLLPRATVVLVSINADLARKDANYLKIQRL
jgi:pyruvate kinase